VLRAYVWEDIINYHSLFLPIGSSYLPQGELAGLMAVSPPSKKCAQQQPEFKSRKFDVINSTFVRKLYNPFFEYL
jgi:hypothetical protein